MATSVIIFIIANLILIKDYVNCETFVIPCSNDSECADGNSNTKCINQECICISNCNKEIAPKEVNKIGETCDLTSNCRIEKSYCLNKKCTCKNGTVKSTDRKKCLKVSEGIGYPCLEDNQCTEKIEASVCSNNVCVCGLKMHLSGEKCISNKTLGEDCSMNEECTNQYSECNGHCSCVKRYVRHGDQCLLQAKTFLSPCVEDAQCIATLGIGSECVQGYCNCKELYQFKHNSNGCVKDLLLNEICSKHEECHQPGYGTSRLECILGRCKCQSSFIEIDDYCISCAMKLESSLLGILLLLLFIYQ